MKKIIIPLVILVLIFSGIILIKISTTKEEKKDDNKIQIITTIFPIYDFVKNIGGDKVEVSMLLSPGVEIHDYEPTPNDIVKINEADVFLYMGSQIEPWADTIVGGLDNKGNVYNATEGINLIKTEEFEKEYENINQNEDEHEENEHNSEYDTHVWLDPTYSIKIVENITKILCDIDKENSEYYTENSNKYIQELKLLDSDIEKIVKSGKRKEIAFGGPFSYAYFIKRYGLDFVSAYDSCGENGEPSVFKITYVIKEMENKNLPVIFYKELSSGNVAKTIADETKTEMLEFNSIHSVSQENLEDGVSYISIMRNNLENLKKALN